MPDWLREWWPVAVLAGQVFFAWVAWSMRKKFVTCDDCEKVRKDRDAANKESTEDFDDRMDVVERHSSTVDVLLKGLPTAKDIHSLGREIEGLRGGQAALRESIKSLGISIDRLDKPLSLLMEHHINGGGK